MLKLYFIITIFFQIENCEIQEKIVELEEGSDGWVETYHFDSSVVSLNGNVSQVSFGITL